MQQIERYGVIALVFLLVTIVAVSFWGDSKSPGFWSRLTGRGKKEAEPTQTTNLIPPAGSEGRAIDGSLPLSPGASDPYVANAADPAPTTGVPSASEPWNAPTSSWTETPATPLPQQTAPPPAVVSTQPAPVPQPVREAPAPAAGPRYVVQRGDSLIRIAARTLGSGSRWTEIQALNANVDPRSLRVGTTLLLPAGAKLASGSATASRSSTTRTTRPAPKPASSASGTYVVRSGDTLSSIAARMLGDGDRWREILALNPGLEPKRLYVGKALRLPDGAGAEIAAAVPRSSARTSDRPRVR